MTPAFVIATDLQPSELSWAHAEAQVVQVREESARILGFEPQVTLAAAPWDALPSAGEIFVLPAPLEFWDARLPRHAAQTLRSRFTTTM